MRNLRSFFKEHSEARSDFKRTFRWLIKQGVILHHQGKGRSADESTVSINAHTSEIEWEPLRNYVSETLSAYGIGRNGNNRE